MTLSRPNVSHLRKALMLGFSPLMLGFSLAFGLTACGGGGGGTTTPNAATLPSGANLASVPVTFTIHIPKRTTSSSKARSPKYISTALQSIDFRLTGVLPTGGGTYTGALNTDTLIPITYANAACTTDADGDRTCTATSTAPAPATATLTIYTYAVASPIVGTTTPLSIYVGYSLAVTVAGPNNAAVSTWGVPTALAFSPAAVSVTTTGSDTLTTSLQVRDAGGATLIGGENFSTSAGVAGSVQMTGCDAKLTPTPATVSAANPTALGTGAISVVYDGSGTAGTTLQCNATAPNGLTAQYSVNLANATITEYATGITAPALGIAAGSDGNLWFTEYSGNRIGKITTAGVITEYTTGMTGTGPTGIAAGSDGNLWFTELDSNRIGKITTAGRITDYTTGITNVAPFGATPYGIAAGPDGNLWFTEYHGQKIGKITTAGVITEYTTGITAPADPRGIAAGSDGNLWFTENSGNKIGKITTAGVITQYTGMTGTGPAGIAAGPDSNLWFTEDSGNKIGKIVP